MRRIPYLVLGGEGREPAIWKVEGDEEDPLPVVGGEGREPAIWEGEGVMRRILYLL